MFDYASLLSRAHVDFAQYLSLPAGPLAGAQLELQWRKRLLASPNGRLIMHNQFFDSLGEPTIWLAHITPKLNSIEQSGRLLMSSGSLVGSLYCVSTHHTGDVFRLHNLGDWIYRHEIPTAVSAGERLPIDVILLEIKLPSLQPSGPIGIDYTRLGSFYYAQYTEGRQLLTPSEQGQLETDVAKRVIRARSFLAEVDVMDLSRSLDSAAARQFVDRYAACVNDLPMLGYLYFEALVEYILCYQNDAVVKRATEQGEFYAHYYKRVAQEVRSALFREFRLGSFAPTVDAILATFEKYVSGGLLFTSFDRAHFLQFLAQRLAYFVRSRCTDAQASDFSSSERPLAEVPRRYVPLVGHLLNLGLRTLPRSLELYYQFGKTRTDYVWDYWDNKGVVVPFNALLPRGEVGINPRYCTKATCTLYVAKAEQGGEVFVIDRKLDVMVAQELIDTRHTVMGYKHAHQANQA